MRFIDRNPCLRVRNLSNPEEETAQRLATRLELKRVLDSLRFDDYKYREEKCPKDIWTYPIVRIEYRDEFLLKHLSHYQNEEKSKSP